MENFFGKTNVLEGGCWGIPARPGSFRKMIIAHVMGAGGMDPQNFFLKFRPFEITSGAFSSKFIVVKHTPSPEEVGSDHAR